MKTLKEERKIIMRAVWETANLKKVDHRNYAVKIAAEIANRRGVNVASADYLHDIFIQQLKKWYCEDCGYLYKYCLCIH